MHFMAMENTVLELPCTVLCTPGCPQHRLDLRTSSVQSDCKEHSDIDSRRDPKCRICVALSADRWKDHVKGRQNRIVLNTNIEYCTAVCTTTLTTFIKRIYSKTQCLIERVLVGRA